MKNISRSIYLLGFAALTGCSQELGDGVEGPSAETASSVVEANGRSLNGRSLNGRSLNGVALDKVVVSGQLTGGIELQKTRFHGVDADGDEIGGRDFVGAIFAGTLDDQTQLPLRIDEIAQKHAKGYALYAVSYLTDGGWAPLCGRDAQGDAVLAVPLEGRWDYRSGVPGGGSKIDDASAFTFACEGFALAKCVDLGYEPWRKVNVCSPGNGCVKTSLAPYHQACTRALRADYCGDGTSFTMNGTLINLYDGAGIQADTEGWAAEAEWTEDGARCIARERVSAVVKPGCWSALQEPACGSRESFQTGTRIISEDAP